MAPTSELRIKQLSATDGLDRELAAALEAIARFGRTMRSVEVASYAGLELEHAEAALDLLAERGLVEVAYWRVTRAGREAISDG